MVLSMHTRSFTARSVEETERLQLKEREAFWRAVGFGDSAEVDRLYRLHDGVFGADSFDLDHTAGGAWKSHSQALRIAVTDYSMLLGSLARVTQLLDLGMHVTARDAAMTQAVELDEFALVELLYARDTDLERPDRTRQLLHIAVGGAVTDTFTNLKTLRKSELARFLLKKSRGRAFIVDAMGLQGETALHHAVSECNRAEMGYDFVTLLCMWGANPSPKNDAGKTPLHIAASKGKVSMVRDLISEKADPRVTDQDGRTPLHCAAFGLPTMQNQEEGYLLGAALRLLNAGADVSIKDNLGETPRDLAMRRGHSHVEWLLGVHELCRFKCVAFAMGLHERLGAGSRVKWLDPGVMRMVLDHMKPCE